MMRTNTLIQPRELNVNLAMGTECEEESLERALMQSLNPATISWITHPASCYDPARPRICGHGHGCHMTGHASPMSPILPLGEKTLLSRVDR
jgi:hypothetical protein